MKFFAVALFLFMSGACQASTIKILDPESPETRFVVDAIIRQLFEMLRTLIKNGNPEKDIPVMDPFKLNDIAMNLPNSLFSISANFSNVEITGLGDYKIQKAEFNRNEVSIKFHANFPKLVFRSEYYEMDGHIFNIFPIAGRGLTHLEIHDLTFTSKIYLKQSDDGKSVLIDYLEDPDFVVKQISSATEFDNNIDDIFNAMVEDLLAEYLNRMSKDIAAFSSTSIADALNPHLNKFESWRIIAVILN